MTQRCLAALLIWSTLATWPISATAAEGSADGDKSCPLHVVAALDMRIMNDGRVTIPAQFDGHLHQLMVDTGGFVNTITAQLASDEGYSATVGGSVLQGIGKRQLMSSVEVKDFSLGKAHTEYSAFYVETFDSAFSDGTLAPNILANYDVDFDFAHDKFNLILPDHCPGQVVYWTKDPRATVPFELEGKSHIRLPVSVDGKSVMAIVNSGSVTSIISLSAATRIIGVEAHSAGMQPLGMISVNGIRTNAYAYSPKALSIGGITIRDAQITIVSESVWNSDDLLLGVDIMRELHFYISYSERKLYLTPASAH